MNRGFQDQCREILFGKFNDIIEKIRRHNPNSTNGEQPLPEIRAASFSEDIDVIEYTRMLPKEMWPFSDITSIAFEYSLGDEIQLDEIFAPSAACFDAEVLYEFHLFLKDNIGHEGIKDV